MENRNAQHSHVTCHPMNHLAKHHVDCIICGGMGRQAIEALNSEGLSIYKAKTTTVGETVELMNNP